MCISPLQKSIVVGEIINPPWVNFQHSGMVNEKTRALVLLENMSEVQETGFKDVPIKLIVRLSLDYQLPNNDMENSYYYESLAGT